MWDHILRCKKYIVGRCFVGSSKTKAQHATKNGISISTLANESEDMLNSKVIEMQSGDDCDALSHFKVDFEYTSAI